MFTNYKICFTQLQVKNFGILSLVAVAANGYVDDWKELNEMTA